MFEDDGKIASGVTSAVYDAERKLLFMNGMWILLFNTTHVGTHQSFSIVARSFVAASGYLQAQGLNHKAQPTRIYHREDKTCTVGHRSPKSADCS